MTAGNSSSGAQRAEAAAAASAAVDELAREAETVTGQTWTGNAADEPVEPGLKGLNMDDAGHAALQSVSEQNGMRLFRYHDKVLDPNGATVVKSLTLLLEQVEPHLVHALFEAQVHSVVRYSPTEQDCSITLKLLSPSQFEQGEGFQRWTRKCGVNPEKLSFVINTKSANVLADVTPTLRFFRRQRAAWCT